MVPCSALKILSIPSTHPAPTPTPSPPATLSQPPHSYLFLHPSPFPSSFHPSTLSLLFSPRAYPECLSSQPIPASQAGAVPDDTVWQLAVAAKAQRVLQLKQRMEQQIRQQAAPVDSIPRLDHQARLALEASHSAAFVMYQTPARWAPPFEEFWSNVHSQLPDRTCVARQPRGDGWRARGGR